MTHRGDVYADPGSPWAWFQPWDLQAFGEVIRDEAEQRRWSQAVFLGGLPWMWRKARVMRELIYDRLELRPGDRVLLLGEAIEASGFADDVRDRVGPEGDVRVVEIIEEARAHYRAGDRGRGGQLATWRYDYVADVADATFDCIAVLQGVQHADDWREAGAELLRTMRPGRRIVLAEIAFGPRFAERVRADVHIEYVFQKLFERVGWHYRDFPYHGCERLLDAFAGLVDEPEAFDWRGIELFWGRKPDPTTRSPRASGGI